MSKCINHGNHSEKTVFLEKYKPSWSAGSSELPASVDAKSTSIFLRITSRNSPIPSFETFVKIT